MQRARVDTRFRSRTVRQVLRSRAFTAAWSRDGQQVRFITAAELYTVAATGGPATRFGVSIPPSVSSVVTAASETTAPAAPTTVGPAVLAGTTATIPYALPADPTASKVVFQRSSAGQPTVTRAVAAPLPLQDTGLVVGRTYGYRVFQVDRSGNAGPAATFRLTATAPPALTAADPTSSASTTTSFVVRFAQPANAFGTRYTVDARVVGRAPSRWATATAAVARRFGDPGVPPGVVATRADPGSTYGFAGFATDVFGNSARLPGMFHEVHLYPQIVPEAAEALADLGSALH